MPNPITGTPIPDPGLPAALRDLAAVLTPGSVISGRILAALGDGNYAVQVRGRSLVAQSGIPLTKGEVVQIQVDSVGDQIRARLLTADGMGANPAGRLQALGLPNTPAGMLVLAAFERLGAPLAPDRLQAATAQVEKAFDWPVTPQKAAAGERLPPPPERLADAFALLARANLPTSAPLMALALRAAQGGLPNPAAVLSDLRQAATTAGAVSPPPGPAAAVTTTAPAPPSAMIPGPSPPPAPGTVPAPAPPTGMPAGSGGQAAQPGAGPPSPAPAPIPMPNAVPAGITGGPSIPTAPAAPAPTTPVLATAVATAVPATAMAAASPAPVVPSAAPPMPPAGSTPAPGATPTPLGTTPPALASPTMPAPASTTVVPYPYQSPGAQGATTAVTWRLALGAPLPDAVRDGAAGIMRALALAGIRSAAEPATTADASRSPSPATRTPEPAIAPSAPLVRQLLTLMPVPGQDQPVAGRGQESPPTMPATVSEAAVRTVHEQTAQTIFPPDDLADYDRVLGLPLMADGRPVPARVAVASRAAPGGGQATFLRVDTELSHLGAVSIRLSGIEGGAMAITLMGDDHAARELAAALPALVEDLRRIGITAGLRVVGDDGIERGGASSHDG